MIRPLSPREAGINTSSTVTACLASILSSAGGAAKAGQSLQSVAVICKYIFQMQLIGYSYVLYPWSRRRWLYLAHSRSAAVQDLFDNALWSAGKGLFEALILRSGVRWKEFPDTMNYAIQIFTGCTFKGEGRVVLFIGSVLRTLSSAF